MKYMLLMYSSEDAWTDAERESCMIESMQVTRDFLAEGKCLAAAPLHSVKTATSLQVRNGKRLVVDGPFAETNEQLGGYYIIDVADLDEALAFASRLPPARKGTVEIRPLYDVSHLVDHAVPAPSATAR